MKETVGEEKMCGCTFCDDFDTDDKVNHCRTWHNILECPLGAAFVAGKVILAPADTPQPADPPQIFHNNQQQKPSRAEELVNAHWDGYVGPLLKSCGVAADLMPMLEFMYKSSGVHFYKHCAEDQQELARKAMKSD